MKLSLALDRAVALCAPDMPILLTGPSGIGKSDGAKWVAAETNRELLGFYPVTKMPEDMAIPRVYETNPGQLVADYFPVGLMRRICDPECPPTLLLIDDIGEVRGPMQGATMHLVLTRQVGDTPVSPNVSMMLCANKKEHDMYANTIAAPLIGRCWVAELEHDNEAFATWALNQPGVDPVVAAYALFRRNCFEDVMPDDGSQYCSPRNLARAGVIIKRMPKIRDVETFTGAVGKATAADLVLFRNSLASLIPLEDMLDDPSLLKQEGDLGLVNAYIVLAAAHVQNEPNRVREFGKKLHSGELRKLLELLAPQIA